MEQESSGRSTRSFWLRADRGYLVAAGAAAAGAVLSLWFSQHGADQTHFAGIPILFFLLPVLVGAIGFGVRGGLIAALLAFGVTTLDPDMGAYGHVSHLLNFVLVGVAAGLFVDRNRRLLAEVSSAQRASADLVSRLTVVAESVADGLITITETGTILRFNTSAERIFGYERAEIIGRNVSVLMPEPDSSRHDGYIAAYLRTGASTIVGRSARDLVAVRADGSLFPIALTVGEATQAEERVFIGAVRDITERKQREEEQQRHEATLEQLVQARTAELQARSEQLEEAHLESLRILALAAEYHDDQTAEHAERVGKTAAALGARLGLNPHEQSMIRQAAPLHDIGKIGVPDTIRSLPGRLSPADQSMMREHTTKGHAIASQSHSEVMQLAAEIALTHHEWWDGTGYPRGLKGGEIPLSGRIVAVADVYDALTHQRAYKRAWTVEHAAAEIHRLSGRQFDPTVVDAFAQLAPSELRAGKAQVTVKVA